MKFNDRGPDVEAVQSKLLRLGYALPQYGADGHLGSETWNALRQYARDRHVAWTPDVPKEVLSDLRRRGMTEPAGLSTEFVEDTDLDVVRFIHIEHDAPDPFIGNNPRRPKSKIVGGRTFRRTLSAINGICLHQMAVEITASARFLREANGEMGLALAMRMQQGTSGKGGVAAPICVHDDLVACTTPLEWYLYAANRLNSPTLSIEVSGRFSGLLDDPNTPPREDLRTTWGTEPPMVLTPARIRALRAAIRYAVIQGRKLGMPIKYIYAHRQSNSNKPGDPGEAIWKAGAIDYAIPALGLEPRNDFTLDGGRPIPRQWDPEHGVGSYY